jgi:hypothetical protein
VRGLVNYISLFVIAFATYVALKAEGGFSVRFLKSVVLIWFTTGLLQVVVSRDLFTGLLSNARTTVSRGVVGLAPEPTAYGIHCLLLLILVSERTAGRTRRWLMGALLIQILIFARSSMTLLFLLIWGALLLATHLGKRRALIGGACVLGVGIVAVIGLMRFADRIQGIRILELIHLAVSAPALILVRDQSISDRVAAITFSLIGAFQGGLLPHGFVSWAAYVDRIGPHLVRYIPHYTAGDRIMSGYGAALYELGFVGLIIPYVVTHTARLRYRADLKRFITIAILLNLLFLTALPLAYPPIGFLIGYFCYYAACSRNVGPPGSAPPLADTTSLV